MLRGEAAQLRSNTVSFAVPPAHTRFCRRLSAVPLSEALPAAARLAHAAEPPPPFQHLTFAGSIPAPSRLRFSFRRPDERRTPAPTLIFSPPTFHPPLIHPPLTLPGRGWPFGIAAGQAELESKLQKVRRSSDLERTTYRAQIEALETQLVRPPMRRPALAVATPVILDCTNTIHRVLLYFTVSKRSPSPRP